MLLSIRAFATVYGIFVFSRRKRRETLRKTPLRPSAFFLTYCLTTALRRVSSSIATKHFTFQEVK